MNLWLNFGIILTISMVVISLVRWGNIRCVGVTPVPFYTFMAILFTSGLDVGLLMFPLTEFGGYADIENNPEYGFTNPLAIEFGFWGFLIWGFYFLTCFYFCIIEPRVKFFEIPLVKVINNLVIIGTCAFTAYLFLTNLPWYIPSIGDGESIVLTFYVIVLAVIFAAAYSSTDIKYVKILSLGSSLLFFSLIIFMWVYAQMSLGSFGDNLVLLSDYFPNIHHFAFPINDYHAFYLLWWFAWSIMIGQFTSRFVGGLRTWQVLLSLLVVPSIPLAIWFSVLYYYHTNSIPTEGIVNLSMITVGILFVINSLDSLIRLYTDNLNLTTARFGKWQYIVLNVAILFGLTILFKYEIMNIEQVGRVVIGIFLAALIYIAIFKPKTIASIQGSPEDREMPKSGSSI